MVRLSAPGARLQTPRMTTEAPAAARTHCPTCGAKITRPDLSICAYCTTPLGLGSAAKESANQKRLAAMKEHELFAASFAWDPPESLQHERGANWRRRGTLAAVLGGLLTTWVFVGPGLNPPGIVTLIGALVLLGLGLFGIVKGSALCKAETERPLLKRCAIVTDRRSETAITGWGGRTVYFFALELEDGSEGEFNHEGRGAQYQPLVPGNTGIAFTRGDRLLAFKPIRV